LKILDRRRKADKANETHDPPISPPPNAPALSALSSFEAVLEQLRAQDLQPPSDGA
jgi:hypothetical protein